MTARLPQGRGVFTLIMIALLAIAGSSQALAKNPSGGNLTATGLSPSSRIVGTKSDFANATRHSANGDRVSVIVKLDDAPLASYQGTVPGLAATRPEEGGQEKLDPKSSNSTRYRDYLKGKQDQFAANAAQAIPSGSITQRFDVVLGGIAMNLPSDQIETLSTLPGVKAIYPDTLRQPQSDASPAFIGATTLYPQLGGAPNAGKGVIFGVLDTGVWPEHPAFADNGNLAAPPPKADGTPRTCDFGDNPLTPAADPFVCNRKLIGGKAFLTAYLSDPARAAAEPYHTARDSEGHGTHTASTSAGDPLATAVVLGVNRGPLNGIAPGAWVSVYKVCGIEGCFGSDSAAAVQQAILDGVSVINFSISGGSDPFNDPVELAFLDAYAAGVFVAASAGNSGPGAATTAHLSPWVTTVAASTQKRAFESTLTLSASGASATFQGASITAGISSPLPVVLASAPPYNRVLCDAPAPPGLFVGKIVACQRSPGRVLKGFNVKQGGAAGMILYNPTLADVETDNHWLPVVHLADGTAFLAFVNSHPGVTASFTAGAKVNGQGDVMAAFSSRGPGGNFIKPDVTAPGVEILAGHTPTPDSVTGGPPGQYFQAIAGTSMSSPHVAGSAILLKALHPGWTPGQIKSALMTTGITKVVKENLTTPADPFDMGAGRINLTVAGNPGLTFEETAARMFALGNDPINAVQLNIPSINAPIMPGSLTTIRTAKNVSGARQTYSVSVKAPSGSIITVLPPVFTLNDGQSIPLSITILSNAPTGQYFGEVQLKPLKQGLPTLHLPVAFVNKQGVVSLTSSCSPTSIAVQQTSTCTITAKNNTFNDTTANLKTIADVNVLISGASGATVVNPLLAVKNNVALAGAQPGAPVIGPAPTPSRYTPLDVIGVTSTPIGDEDLLNFNVPAFLYNGVTYNSIGVDSNGYLVVGGGTSQDNNCCGLVPIPNPARPNNVLAPFWTDLDGTGAPGIYVATLTDGVSNWIVVEWRVNVFGTSSLRTFQTWIGVNGVQDISFAYDPLALPGNPFGQPFLVGAENANGSGGQGLPIGTLPTGDLVVTSTDPIPGASVSYTVTVRGLIRGNGNAISLMDTPAVPGTTIVTSPITVTRR